MERKNTQETNEEEEKNPPREEAVADFLEKAKKALDDKETELANKYALEAMHLAKEATECFSCPNSDYSYSEQQLAEWFTETSWVFSETKQHMDAVKCFSYATVFEPRWSEMKHNLSAKTLWDNIFVTPLQLIFNFQEITSFLEEINKIANLSERLEKRHVCNVICLRSSSVWEHVLLSLKLMAHLGVSMDAHIKSINQIARDTSVMIARCGLSFDKAECVRYHCKRVLDDFTDYNDAEALEIWGKSLMAENNYVIAEKNISLALKCAKEKDQIERLKKLLDEIKKHLNDGAKSQEPDAEWLLGTEAERQEMFAAERGIQGVERKKKKHQRPKKVERVQTTDILATVADVRKTDDLDDDLSIENRCVDNQDNTTQKKDSKQRNTTRIQQSTSHLLLELSSDSDSDESCVDDVSVASDKNILSEDDELDNDDTLTYYEQSCSLYEDDNDIQELSSNVKIFRQGLKLDEMFIRQIKESQRKTGTEFYEKLLDEPTYQRKLKEHPDKYLHCTIQIENAHTSYCKPVDSSCPIPIIEISGRAKAGQTFKNDEVVVEIADSQHDDKRKYYGKVVGIIKRNCCQGIKHPVFICTLDDRDSHLVKPLCKTVPKINILYGNIMKTCPEERRNKIEVYNYNHTDGTLELDRIEDIKSSERHKYAFLVAYIQWERQQYNIYPVGAVIKILPFGNSIKSGLKILDIQHEIPTLYSSKVVKQTERLKTYDEPPGHLTKDRIDLTSLHTFTIDPQGSNDIDDALSIEELEDGFKIGVHIADVSAYIKKGDDIDVEAYERAVSFYPVHGRPRHMLPEPLSQDICSLVPGKKRLCISVFHYLNENGLPLPNKNVEFILAVIESKKQLTYEETQAMIVNQDDSAKQHVIFNAVKQLFSVAKRIRERRLGNSMYAFDLEEWDFIDDASEKKVEAKYLVEEFMLLTNFKIGKYLMQKYPKLVPLRCQPPPNKEHLKNLLETDGVILNLVLKLQGKSVDEWFRPNFENILQTENDQHGKMIPVYEWVWDDLIKSPKASSPLVLKDELHPLQYIAYQHWLSIQEHAFYRCSGNKTDRAVDGRHFSLKDNYYTHFTSPIRRYPDLVVHRLLKSLLENEKAPYTSCEIEAMCHRMNSAVRQAKAYNKSCHNLKLAVKFKSQPKMIPCFVTEVSDKGISFCAPELKTVSKSHREMTFNLFNMRFRPEKSTVNEQPTVITNWYKRLYDFRGVPALPVVRNQRNLHLNQFPGIRFISTKDWANIIKCILNHDEKTLQTVIQKPICLPRPTGIKDINSECNEATGIQPCTSFSLLFTRGQPVYVQMTADAERGLLVPKPQLFSITNNIKCCLEHVADPVKYLTTYSRKPSQDQYETMNDYLDIWLPLVAMEAAVGAVSYEETFTINNLPIKFRGRTGKFSLLQSYCEKRNITFRSLAYDDEGEEECDLAHDYMCIKCSDGPIGKERKDMTCSEQSPVWLSHAVITKVRREGNKVTSTKSYQKNDQTTSGKVSSETDDRVVKVCFKLHSLSMNPPMNLANENGVLNCGVEMLIQTDVDRRTQNVLHKLRKVKSTLAERIALNKDIIQPLEIEEVLLWKNVPEKLKDKLKIRFQQKEKGYSGERYRAIMALLFYFEFFCADDESFLNTHTISHLLSHFIFEDPPHAHAAERLERDLVIRDSLNVPSDRVTRHRPVPQNNEDQQSAIDKALGNRFTLIQGPPGTGKTYTGIKLLYLFSQINISLHKEGTEKYQVLFCGPSNKSVDLVARLMLERLGDLRPDIVRVYGSSIESIDFPVPGRTFITRGTSNLKVEDNLKCVALHHLIRQKGKPFAETIKGFDRQFKQSSYVVETKEVKEYVKTTKEASIMELKEHDVILCTTAVASNSRLKLGTKVFQIIIDEAGMCPEPHCLVPIVASKAEQVVLIGDHKQLRPDIKCKEAAELGLEKSLFEKQWLSENAQGVEKVMLKRQYRMNPQLCHFPSQTFYDGQLQTEPGFWKKGRSILNIWSKKKLSYYPHVIIDLEGVENNLTVTSEEGNEQSKSNDAEVDQVVRVYRYLIKQTKEESFSSINIISQYNSQCNAIRERLEKERLQTCKVNTVVSSQGGEWDYVIISTVRSQPEYKIEKRPTQGWCKMNLGFITDEHQINVALTRAKKGLVIIGNTKLLRCDKTWKKLIEYYESCDCVKTPEEFPPV